MSEMWDRTYLERRLARCETLARKAKIFEVRQMHLRFAQHYQKIIDGLAA